MGASRLGGEDGPESDADALPAGDRNRTPHLPAIHRIGVVPGIRRSSSGSTPRLVSHTTATSWQTPSSNDGSIGAAPRS